MSEITQTIKFLDDVTVRDERADTPLAERYSKDQTVELPDASARHWVSRGKAEYVVVRSESEDKSKTASKKTK